MPRLPTRRHRVRRASAAGVTAGLLTLAGACSGAPESGSAVPGSTARGGVPGSEASTGLGPVLRDALAEGPRRATTARQVARQVEESERAISDAATPPDVLAAAAHVQQLAYRVLGARPQWDEQVLARVPRRFASSVRANVAARREFKALQGTRLADMLPAWRIVAPEPAEALRGYFRAAERRSGVDWEYLAAINLVETGMGRIRGTSVAGAQGPMQFIPTTWDQWGRGDITSPRDSILAAGRFLAGYGFNEPGGVSRALFRYNNSSAYVRAVTALARVMQQRPRTFFGYHGWQIYYVTDRGDVLLPEGYAATRPIPVGRYLADNPQR